MKNNEWYLFLITKIFKTKKNIILMLILALLLIILSTIFCSSHTLLNYIHNINTKSREGRSFTIYKDELYNNYFTEEEINKIKDLKNISDVYTFNYNYPAFIRIDQNKSLALQAVGHNELANIDIINGSKNISGNNIICPSNLTFSDKNDSRDFVNGNDYIGTNFNITMQKIGWTEDEYNPTSILLDSKNKIYHVIGTYDSEKYMLENYICLTSFENVKEIRDFENVNDESVMPDPNLYVLVNKGSNVERAKEDIRKIIESDLIIQSTFVYDFEFLLIVGGISLGVIFFGILMIFVIIDLNIKRNLSQQEKEILLYRSIGYDKNQIRKIYLFQYFIILSLAFLISIIIFIILFLIVKKYLTKTAIFHLIKITYNFVEIMLLITIGILLPIYKIRKKLNNILNIDNIREVKE